MKEFKYKGYKFYYKNYYWYCDKLKPWSFKKEQTARDFIDKGINFLNDQIMGMIIGIGFVFMMMTGKFKKFQY